MSGPRPHWSRRHLATLVAVPALGVSLFLAGGLGLAPEEAARPAHAPAGPPVPRTAARATDLATLQARVRDTPRDPEALGALGLAYVQKARTSGDPSYYPKAEAVLRRSLAAEKTDNFTAMGGMAALEAARHRFADGLGWARRAVAANPWNATLYGTLADAYTQLGRYAEASDAVQRMVDLKPGTPSFSRASYAAELRGDTAAARGAMRRALDAANGPDDTSFARYYLSELAFGSGDAETALSEAEAGLRATPGAPSLLQARARARAALGRGQAATEDLSKAVQALPLPEYLVQLGELYESLGKHREAERQFAVFRAEQRLFAANGVALDSDAALFEADHGDPRRALPLARAGLRGRPFLDSHDALAWALHKNGRDREALTEADRALALGTRNALFTYHRAMILKSLGDKAAARTGLRTALATNPHFSPLHAPLARAALKELDQRGDGAGGPVGA
ncbi:Flp pilus assembly protein TadD, contains TPR repeats [Streptomyces sp. TverLS-915]|uniref:tetratricopeptide repeat protein n=1 Tax=Streptomyces sp. TverLS-915 TaxID=1839763 RepID=UPI00081DB304|nr:tetratricopeptide repeat protein [Streptomyces sp. TverLS-915]SCD31648.1 Flp pilus assembly protein TadD, contains TPR repeats [Streptomyces sp. TverLS-915]